MAQNPYLQAAAPVLQLPNLPAVQLPAHVTAADVVNRDQAEQFVRASNASVPEKAAAMANKKAAAAAYAGIAVDAGGMQAVTNQLAGLANQLAGLQGVPNQVAGLANQLAGLQGVPNQVAGLANQLAGLQGVPNQVAGLANQVASLSNQVAGLQGVPNQVAGLPGVPNQVAGLANQVAGLANQVAGLQGVPNQLAGLQGVPDQLERLVASNSNVRPIVHNAHVPLKGRLMRLCVEDGGGQQQLGTLPGVGVPFPNTPSALARLTGAQLNALEAFYGRQFVGQNVGQRREAFANFIGARVR